MMENTCMYTVHTNNFWVSVATQMPVSFLKNKTLNLIYMRIQVQWLHLYLLIAHIFLIELLSVVREAQREATKGKQADGDKTARGGM